MHGRLKVRTTEEERERKKKEQALKVKAYRAAMSKILSKRQNNEYDDEMLQCTTPILQRNPDVSTLWNIRRECILTKQKNINAEEEENNALEENNASDEKQEENKENAESKEQRIQKVFDVEISLTEQCLLVNPKSYNIWHHRSWLLENAPTANWAREVMLCNKYLKMDERNFHTWDYRRYVVEKAKVEKKDELDFCTEKIKINFSNYSSWHHRSLLLPQLYPYEGEAKPKRAMSENKLKEELEMVLTAAFTDPNDSSAWFYQRWLLGHSRPDLEVAAFRCNNEKAIIALTKPILKDNLQVKLTDGSGKMHEITNWQCVREGPSDCCFVAREPKENPLDFQTFEIISENFKSKTLMLKTFNNSAYYFHALAATSMYTTDVLEELKHQLELCESLLEYEPDSKWCLLTSALLMRAIDTNGEYHAKSLKHLNELQKLDNLRENYYKDLASKWIFQKYIREWYNSENIPSKLDLSTASEQLSSLTDPQYLAIADEIVLSDTLSARYGKDSLKTFNEL